MKNLVLTSVDSIVLNDEVYQGSRALGFQVQDSEELGLRTLVIKYLFETLAAGTKVFYDHSFTTTQAVNQLRRNGLYLSGIV